MEKKSSSRFRIDEQVFFTMILVGILALIVLAFRLKTDEPCKPIQIKFTNNGSVFFQDAPVSFNATTKGGKTFEWDFGDGSQLETRATSNIIHTYKTARTYTVTVTVNGQCDEEEKIVIKRAPVFVDKRMLPQFSVPDSAIVGKPVTFTDSTEDATSWEWSFGETGNVDNKKRVASYMFTSHGPKTIYLKINGRPDRASTKMIYVKENPRQRPEEDTRQRNDNGGRSNRRIIVVSADSPTTPHINVDVPIVRAPEVSNEQLRVLLMQVVSGEKKAGDFSEYLCGKLNIMVVYNNKTMTFSEMCNKIRGVKKQGKVRSLVPSQFRNGTDGCIESMNVVLEKKGLFG